jgi:5-methylcytosine-specific restriction protein A
MRGGMMRAEFTRKTKAAAFLRCKGLCESCGSKLSEGNTEYHHRIEAAEGGDNSLANCVVLCKTDHSAITRKVSIPRVAKIRRQRDKSIGAKKSSGTMPYGKDSPHRKKLDGTLVWRATGEPVRRPS